MVPWSIRRVTSLPPNAKLHEIQQNTHGLVQLIRAATPHIPNQTPMPLLSFFFLTDSRSSKSTQDCACESGCLQHMIQWIPAKRGTWQRPRVHMRITKGSLLR